MSPPPGSAPPIATVHYAPPMAHALSRPHAAAAAADKLLPDDGSDSESVAESSCPGQYSRRPAASGFLGDSDEDDDDGCSSCVEGNDCGYQEADGDEEEVSTASVWWKKRLAAGGAQELQREDVAEVEDPERAAARQAEDRKFWEDCLGTGYP